MHLRLSDNRRCLASWSFLILSCLVSHTQESYTPMKLDQSSLSLIKATAAISLPFKSQEWLCVIHCEKAVREGSSFHPDESRHKSTLESSQAWSDTPLCPDIFNYKDSGEGDGAFYFCGVKSRQLAQRCWLTFQLETAPLPRRLQQLQTLLNVF